MTALAQLEDSKPPSPPPPRLGDLDDGYGDDYAEYADRGEYGHAHDEYDDRSGSERSWSGSDYDDGDYGRNGDSPRYRRRRRRGGEDRDETLGPISDSNPLQFGREKTVQTPPPKIECWVSQVNFVVLTGTAF